MTSRRPYWCPKTMKRRPCWCPKPIRWELNSFLMQTLSFVSINLHRCWPREWKHSIVYGVTRTFPYFGYLTLSWTGSWTGSWSQGQIPKVWKCPRTLTNYTCLLTTISPEGEVNSGQAKVRRFLGIFLDDCFIYRTNLSWNKTPSWLRSQNSINSQGYSEPTREHYYSLIW